MLSWVFINMNKFSPSGAAPVFFTGKTHSRDVLPKQETIFNNVGGKRACSKTALSPKSPQLSGYGT